ncbi:MAG: 2-oxoacid:acceptor oxidoreductase family protein, partial [Gammaproteobacteria bacterium]|nr:2-oxoacid:acceptor oxidoreductase family protein [Gammaproteobacteria bacterium]
KEFTPAMVKSIFDMLSDQPKNNFTIGVYDDVSFSSLEWDESFRTDANKQTIQAMFYGLGSDGTVSANKNSIKIIGESTELKAQGYFVYDSKKSGAVTVSHLRFGPTVIRSTYLIGDNDANFIACHQSAFLQRYNMLDKAAENSIFLLNSALPVDQVWNSFPAKMQQQCIDKKVQIYVIDAYAVAMKSGMGKRINTIMQTCFFAISGVLPQQQAIEAIKAAVVKTYGRKGQRIIDMNFKAIDETLACLQQLELPGTVSSQFEIRPPVSAGAPEFVQKVTAQIIAGEGDSLAVSDLPVDGTYPTGTAAYEKRNLALEIPVWENDICSQCGKCPLVCPHAAIRSKIYSQDELVNAPQNFKSMPMKGKGFAEGSHISYQVAAEDCTGCGLCVDICPIRDKTNASRKALNMRPIEPLLEQEKENWAFYLQLPEYDRAELKVNTIKGAMALEPLFEFSGACTGCGETPYVKLASQLFGDRMLVANATGCSSIYGGNLPTTPWTKNSQGRGPAWNNSLFEDNAEFGLGMRVAADKHKQQAIELLKQLKPQLDSQLVDQIIGADELTEAGISEQRERVDQLAKMLTKLDSAEANLLSQLTRYLCRLSVWIMGGDGWAYDIGYGGLDHV